MSSYGCYGLPYAKLISDTLLVIDNVVAASASSKTEAVSDGVALHRVSVSTARNITTSMQGGAAETEAE